MPPSLLMITGYAIIAVPTGIVTTEMGRAQRSQPGELTCARCGSSEHRQDVNYCHRCGERMAREAAGARRKG
jgi:voltage-gated potassium channel